MPQASEELRGKFPGGDGEALAVLRDVCSESRGHLRPRSQAALAGFTSRHWEAIDYLHDEWDYTFNMIPADEVDT